MELDGFVLYNLHSRLEGVGVIKLQEILDERDMMQKELAAELGLPKTTMHNYATGKRQADYDTLVRICDVLGVTMDYLFGRSSNPAPSVSDEDAALLHAYHAAPMSIRAAITTLLQPYQKGTENEADQVI